MDEITFYNGQKISHVLEDITVSDVMNDLPEVFWSARCSKNRSSLYSSIALLSVPLQDRILRLAEIRKETQDRHKIAYLRDTSSVQKRRLDSSFEEAQTKRQKLRHTVCDDSEYLEPVSDAVRDACLNRFIQRTTNQSLHQDVCMVCANRYETENMIDCAISNIPNRDKLIPEDPHPAMKLIDNMLLHTAALRVEHGSQYGYVCNDCWQGLTQTRKFPKLSLCNNMWIGEVPFEMQILTLPEKLLIALYYPCAYIIKLFPKQKNARRWKVSDANAGIRGNVSTYKLNTDNVFDLISGSALPRHADALSVVVSVCIVGPQGFPDPTLRTLFQVRRDRVRDAILWLKKNNPLYENVYLDNDNLLSLPEHDIPDSILETIQYNYRTEVLESERDGVVPEISDDESDDETENASNKCTPTLKKKQSMDNVSEFDSVSEKLNEELSDCNERNSDKPANEINSSDREPLHHSNILLQETAVVDVHGHDISDELLMASAMTNTSDRNFEITSKADFVIHKEPGFVNEYPRRDLDGVLANEFDGKPNHLLGAFPYLFPYGRGGFETQRPYNVSYSEHAKWAIRYDDRRFSRNMSFLSQIFGVQQKRMVCKAAELRISSKDYLQHEHLINQLNPRTLLHAAEQERRHEPYSDEGVKALRRMVSATRRHVIGTSESRLCLRSKIYGMVLQKNPPSLWITINPADYDDPIVQIFCGESIDMDNFDAHLGPDKTTRAINAIHDPYACTKFFFYIINAVLEELFGFKTDAFHHITRKEGIFGKVAGYVGAVEAQGRGTLHVHMLLWILGAPTSKKMNELLLKETFRDKIRNFIQKNIVAHVDGFLEEEQLPSKELKRRRTIHKERASAYSRPLNPYDINFQKNKAAFELSFAKISQFHMCTNACQFINKNKKLVCKRRAPWPLSDKVVIEANGEWRPVRKHGMLNTWNPSLMLTVRANHDIKLLTNGIDTRHLSWYVVNYAVKPPRITYNAPASFVKPVRTRLYSNSNSRSLRERNKTLLTQCVNCLNRHQELSSQQIISYLMGWGDRFESHLSVPIYWTSAMQHLRSHFSEFRDTSTNENEHSPPIHLQIVNNSLQIKNQLNDYINRGAALENYCFYYFVLETYEITDHSRRTGRNERVPYDNASPQYSDRFRAFRDPQSEVIPDFMGSWLPRRDNPQCYSFYCACVLLLFKPWRNISSLKYDTDSWKDSLTMFLNESDEHIQDILDNFQYYYASGDSAQLKSAENNTETSQYCVTSSNEPFDSNSIEFENMEMVSNIISDDGINPREAMHGQKAVDIATELGIFPATQTPWEICGDTPKPITKNLLSENVSWQNHLTSFIKDSDELLQNFDESPYNKYPNVKDTETIIYDTATYDDMFSHLNTDQQKPVAIIQNCLTSYLKGNQPNQLLMLITGSGGVGKSKVIQTVSELYRVYGVEHLLAKTATTGVAASHIGGSTIHWWAGIPAIMRKTCDYVTKPSQAIAERRKTTIQNASTLIIDEISMAYDELLGLLSQIICYQKSGDPTLPFGGCMNVILVGDFHQFPPVKHSHGVLYRSTASTSIVGQLGQNIFKQFTTVTVLKQQMRIHDPIWQSILERARTGQCKENDIREFDKLVLTNPNCNVPDFSNPPWSNSILITPRHGVRIKWNHAALRQHCLRTNQTLFVSPSEDTIAKDMTPLIQEHISQLSKMSPKLPANIELAEGMRALITSNVSVSANLANGTQGTIEKIFLDPREPPLPDHSQCEHQLKYPPRLLYFRPDRPPLIHFNNLEPGIIPIEPQEIHIQIKLSNGKSVNIKRRQLALNAAYAFTDYKAQSQTFDPVLVDPAKPPTARLTPFNAYVALSRSTGRNSIRFLRDFEPSLFTSPCDPELLKFDNELLRLDNITTHNIQHLI